MLIKHCKDTLEWHEQPSLHPISAFLLLNTAVFFRPTTLDSILRLQQSQRREKPLWEISQNWICHFYGSLWFLFEAGIGVGIFKTVLLTKYHFYTKCSSFSWTDNVAIVWANAVKSGHKQFYNHSPRKAYYCPADFKSPWNRILGSKSQNGEQ